MSDIEAYELTPDVIFARASDYASYEELEQVAKGLYGMYVQRRKHEQPAQDIRNREARRQFKRRKRA